MCTSSTSHMSSTASLSMTISRSKLYYMHLLDILGLVTYFSSSLTEFTLFIYYIFYENISLFLNHSMTEPRGLWVTLHMVLFIFWVFSLGMILLALYLMTSHLFYLLQFTINTYLWLCNTPVSNIPLFKSTTLQRDLACIAYFCHCLHFAHLVFTPLLYLSSGPLLLPLKSPWSIMTEVHVFCANCTTCTIVLLPTLS